MKTTTIPPPTVLREPDPTAAHLALVKVPPASGAMEPVDPEDQHAAALQELPAAPGAGARAAPVDVRGLGRVLLRHAAESSAMASLAAKVEEELLQFACAPGSTTMLPGTIHLVGELETVRSGLVAEIQRTYGLMKERPAPIGTWVVVTPAPERPRKCGRGTGNVTVGGAPRLPRKVGHR